MDQKEQIIGKVLKKDGQYIIKTRFQGQGYEIEVPIEEIIEDFEGRSVEISVSQKNSEDPIFKQDSWENAPETKCDPDYKHASPEAYEKFLDMKFGMMIHFGLYTHLGLLESWSVHNQKCPNNIKELYYTMHHVFNPSEFNADEWAELAERAGMQFFQLTTKHHEGFCLFDTRTKTKALKRIGHQSNIGVNPYIEEEMHFSVMESPFKRDIVRELIDAFRKKNLGIGLYFSHIDWNDPNFRWDPANRSFDPTYGPDTHPKEWKAFIEREREQLREIFSNYGQIDQIFFDGTWFGLAWEEMKSIIKEMRKLQPNCMFSDRGIGPYADFTSPERWIPKDLKDNRLTDRARVWQVCDPIGTHWSWVPDEKYKPFSTLLRNFIDAVAKGGTYVFDVNPMPNGKYPQETIDLLERIGRWLKVNGDGIYKTRRWETKYQENDNIYYTRSKDKSTLYAIHIGWPKNQVVLSDIIPKSNSKIRMLGVSKNIPWKLDGNNLILSIPDEFNNLIPCEYAFTFKIQVN